MCRSSDVKQFKAERDILHSMTHASPHPFTTGLKFAFQSENNLYLGMDYLPGGNLRQLIQRFGCLPEVHIYYTIYRLHYVYICNDITKKRNINYDIYVYS